MQRVGAVRWGPWWLMPPAEALRGIRRSPEWRNRSTSGRASLRYLAEGRPVHLPGWPLPCISFPIARASLPTRSVIKTFTSPRRVRACTVRLGLARASGATINTAAIRGLIPCAFPDDHIFSSFEPLGTSGFPTRKTVAYEPGRQGGGWQLPVPPRSPGVNTADSEEDPPIREQGGACRTLLPQSSAGTPLTTFTSLTRSARRCR